MANASIRTALKNKGMRQWQLADALNIHEKTLCCKLRHELPQDEQTRMLHIIESFDGGAEHGESNQTPETSRQAAT